MGMNIKSLLILTVLGIFVFSSCDAGASKEVIETIEVNNKKYKRYADTYYFRGTVWGMTKDEVIEIEGKKPDSTVDKHIFFKNLKVNDLAVDALYMFDKNGKLFNASYTFLHDDGVTYVKRMMDYDKVKNTLQETYGVPTESVEEWVDENDLDRDDSDKYKYAKAVGDGRLNPSEIWEQNGTRITLKANKSLKGISITVVYSDIEALDKEIENMKKESQEQKEKKEQKEKNNKL